ncbi:MAG: hypothetical protein VR72_02855 [Clostridiaceae bacterium BRH_c20a]|nr:MAG: hypothetical protein VR72_02855 [Clostridiaceae bacterium BRH_c20a]
MENQVLPEQKQMIELLESLLAQVRGPSGRRYEDLPDMMDINELKTYLNIGINATRDLVKLDDFPKFPYLNTHLYPKELVREWIYERARGKWQRRLKKVVGS